MREKKKISGLLLVSLIGLVFVSCELQEEAIHQHVHNSNAKLYEMKFEELMTNKSFVTSFSKLPKSKKNLTTAALGRTVMENEYGFTIADKPAKVIEDNGETSYTFLITRDSTDANSFENLVIQTDSTNTTKAVILKYNLTSPITSSADDSYSFTYNREITPIVYNNTTVSENSKMVIVCYWVYSLVCNNTRTGGIGPEHIAGPNCGRTYYNWTEECFSFDDGISNSGGSGSTGSGPTGGSTNTGSNVGSGGTGGANSINTSPVNNINYEKQRKKCFEVCNPLENEWLNLPENTDVKIEVFKYLENQTNQNSLLSTSSCYENDVLEFALNLIETSKNLEINAAEIWNNDYEGFRNQMSITERAIFDDILPNRKMWYMVSAKKAFDKANELFPPSTNCNPHNGKGDAFRHALWNALCTGFFGADLTEQLTTAHENRPPAYSYNYKENNMDLYNNHKGRIVGGYSNVNNVISNTLQYLQIGGLRYLNDLDSNCFATYSSILIPTN